MKIELVQSPAILAGHTAAQSFLAPCFDDGAQATENYGSPISTTGLAASTLPADGGDSAVALPVRAIIADAARLGSAGIVLAHNYPSGDPTPSAADCRATRTLARTGETIDMAVVDHLVFAPGGQCRSFRRMGLL